MTTIITYQSPAGATIDLTPEQVAGLESANAWPTDMSGEECCTVSHAAHKGEPTCTDAELVSYLLGDDGQCWETRSGITLGQIAEAFGADTQRSDEGNTSDTLTRHVFRDGTAIVEAGDAMTPAALQRARRALGWSQSRLAEALGYQIRHVQKLEAGDSPIPKAVELAMELLAQKNALRLEG